jgi:hypothetical protein
MALDYLLAAPFRYHPARSGLRFRSGTDSDVFYDAETVHTAAELDTRAASFLRMRSNW